MFLILSPAQDAVNFRIWASPQLLSVILTRHQHPKRGQLLNNRVMWII